MTQEEISVEDLELVSLIPDIAAELGQVPGRNKLIEELRELGVSIGASRASRLLSMYSARHEGRLMGRPDPAAADGSGRTGEANDTGPERSGGEAQTGPETEPAGDEDAPSESAGASGPDSDRAGPDTSPGRSGPDVQRSGSGPQQPQNEGPFETGPDARTGSAPGGSPDRESTGPDRAPEWTGPAPLIEWKGHRSGHGPPTAAHEPPTGPGHVSGPDADRPGPGTGPDAEPDRQAAGPDRSGSRAQIRLMRAMVLLVAASAFVAIWGGWVGLGGLAGFGPVNLLPGIGSGLEVDLSITLPLGIEAYAAIALYIAVSGLVVGGARWFAYGSAFAALAIGAFGQATYHVLSADQLSTAAPTPVVIFVSILPVLVLGGASTLLHLVERRT